MANTLIARRVGMLPGALLSQEKFNNKAYFIDI